MSTPRLFLVPYGEPAYACLSRLIAMVKHTDSLAPITVVVPTPYAGLVVRHRLGTTKGLINVRFMVLARLAAYLGAPPLAQQGKQPSSPLLELAVLHAVTATTDAGPLAHIAQHPSVLNVLRDACHTLDRLPTPALQRLASLDPLRAQFVQWYRQFRSRLHTFYRPEELLRAAATAVRRGEAASTLRDLGFIIVYLVPDLSPAELALLQALGTRGCCAVIAGLTGEEGPDTPVRQYVTALAPVLGPVQTLAAASSPALPQQLVSAPDAYEEVRWVMRHLTHRAERGVPFARLAVFYRQREPYATLLVQQLCLAGIPVAGPDPTPLRETPAGKLLVLLLTAITEQYSRDTVMRWLSECPVADPGGKPLWAGDVSRWDRLARQAGITADMTQWRQRLRRLHTRLEQQLSAGENFPADADTLRADLAALKGLQAFVQRLETLAPPPAGSPWRAYARWASDLLRTYATDPATWPPAHRDSFSLVLRTLEELALLDSVTTGTDFATFRALLEEALATPAGRLGPTDAGVLVAPLAVAPGLHFDTVYLVGMAEGAFPPPLAEDPLLPDHVRASLDLPALLPLRQSQRHGERRLYLTALAIAHQRVATYARVDLAGQRGQAPAPWFLEAATHLHGHPVGAEALTRLHTSPWFTLIHSAPHALIAVKQLGPADLHDYDLASVARWCAAGRDLATHYLAAPHRPLGRALHLERQRSSLAFTAWDGKVSELVGHSTRLGVPQGSPLAPTVLERWATCPFRYFLHDVLGLVPLTHPEDLLFPLPVERGRLLHTILERFVRTVMHQGTLPAHGAPWQPAHQELLLTTAEEAFAEAEATGLTGRPLLWEALKHEMRRDLLLFLEVDNLQRAKQQTRPLAVECHFGLPMDGSWAAVTLELPYGEVVQFRGIIDRVDVDVTGTKAVVIDYKTGSASRYRDMPKDALGGGRFLQLPVYALAVRRAFPHLQEVEARYWFVTARGGFSQQPVVLQALEERFRNLVSRIAAGMRQGLFPARPGDCTYCAFDRLCPRTRHLLWERKAQDAALAPYLTLIAPPEEPLA